MQSITATPVTATGTQLAPPCFKPGDRVMWESAPPIGNLPFIGEPRWIMNRDYGESGVWVIGHVTYITPLYVRVYAATAIEYAFPNHGNMFYDPCQWQKPGYLQHYLPLGNVSFDAGVALQTGCDCGAEKCRTTHADWCSTRRA